MRPRSLVLFPMGRLLFLSQRRHQTLAARTALPAALIPPGAPLPSMAVPFFTSSHSSSATHASMEGTPLLRLPLTSWYKAGIRSLEVPPTLLACLLVRRSVVSAGAPSCSSTPALPMASGPGPPVPPSLLTCTPAAGHQDKSTARPQISTSWSTAPALWGRPCSLLAGACDVT